MEKIVLLKCKYYVSNLTIMKQWFFEGIDDRKLSILVGRAVV